MCTEGPAPTQSSGRFLLWFVIAVVLFQGAIWNARVGNTDTFHQLVATVHLVQTGSLGLTDRELATVGSRPDRADQFVQGENGRWYQAHDPGNKVLMVPAVILATLVGRQPANTVMPSSTTKILAAASIAAFAVLLPLLLFLALREVLAPRRALRWAALGVVATVLLPYSKQTWDVYPCAVLTAGMAWMALRRVGGPDRRHDVVMMFAFAAGAAWFRTSVAPFLLLGCVITEIAAARRCPAWSEARRRWVGLAWGMVTFVIVCAPVAALNARIVGNPLRPPLATQTANLAFGGPLGSVGLLVAPNRGLLVFTPVLVLGIGVVWLWRDLSAVLRHFVTAWVVPVAGYLLAIGSFEGWGRFGWGPRYLVPIVPILWVPTAVVATRLVDLGGVARVAASIVVGVSIVLAVLPTLTAWDAVSATGPEIIADDAPYPRQIVETIVYTGREIPLEDDRGADLDVDTKQWPDLAVVYAARKASLPALAGGVVFVGLLVLSALAFGRADLALADGRRD